MYAGHFDFSQPMLWTTEALLSPSECERLIAQFEAEGPELATINTRPGGEVRTEIRNNSRVIRDDPKLARTLFERAAPHVPQTVGGMSLCGANERLRFYRYGPGEYFGLHRDGYFQRDEQERSLLTFMVYLNEGFEGGETDFPEMSQTIVPKTGQGLFFQHRLLHEGKEVTRGVKYALRSDVMYRQAR